MSDNEHTAASLRHSEVLSVKYRPDHAIPEFGERFDDCLKVSAPSTREESRDIFPNNPVGTALSNEPSIFPPECATVTSQASAVSCDRVILTGESSNENIDSWGICEVMDVSVVGDVGPMVV
jgi:hypothetical protein